VAKRVGGKAPAKRQPRPLEDTATLVYFGQRVRALREERGLSQENLAHLVGMAQARLPAIEAGRRDVRLTTIRRFAQALGVTLSELLPVK
jgi:transcriptional regulator with XRE-family HTH domain